MTDQDTPYETERLLLEPLSASHAGELFEILSDSRLYQFVPQDPPPTLAALEARFRRLETRLSPRGTERWLNWALRLKSSRRCLGSLQATIRQDASSLLAYEIGSAYWRQGIATEACRRLIVALFEDFGVRRVIAEVDTRNTASIRLLERLGFERGELKRNADFFKGSASDEFTFTLRGRARGGA